MEKVQFKNFLSLVSDSNTANLARISDQNNKSGGGRLRIYPTYDRIFERIGINAEEVRPFMFSGYENTEEGIDLNEFRLNLPFETVFFEALDRPLLVKDYHVSEFNLEHPKGRFQGSYPISVHYKAEVRGILVHEVDVDTYYIVGLDHWYYHDFSDPHSDPKFKSTFENDFKGVLAKSYTYEGLIRRADTNLTFMQRQLRPELALHKSLMWMCESLRSRSFVTGTFDTREKFRVGNGSKRKKISLNNIIVVTNQKGKSSVETGLSGHGKIDWSHRFEVRGHWRKVAGIGKDRHGQRSVDGYTWITDYAKGPEDKPLIRKSRLVNGPLDKNEGQAS